MIKDSQWSNKNHHLLLILFFVFFTLLLAACTNKEQPKQKLNGKKETSNSASTHPEENWKLPIAIPEGEFYKVGGWMSETEVLYITNLEQTSSVYLYNLKTGKNKLIYKSKYPIVTIQISPLKKNILIHSSPSSYEGLVTIIDTKGNEQLQKSFTSYELSFEWNPYNESQILVTKFNEDWTFQLTLLETNNSSEEDISLPQPFNKWVDEQNVAYLNWSEENLSLYAPITVRRIDNGIEKVIFPDAIHFSTYHDLLFTVSVKEGDQKEAVYTFFNKEMRELFTFSIPQLTKFSDWLVPFYDYSEKISRFITFEPLKSGELDSYTDGFNLVSYDPKKGSRQPIIENLQNEPISFSPSGDILLYGNRFEKLIHLKTKKIYDLVKE